MKMKRELRLSVIALLLGLTSFIQIAAAEMAKESKMDWWREARFGMFIHWGVYAVPGGVYKGFEQNRGGAEWCMNRMKIPVTEYQAYAKQFNPVKFDADAWVKIAKDAGMKYIVITTKHHDGFAMFKSEASKWNIVDATPYGKDVLKQLAAACKKEGIKLGFYYSHAQDWNNPGGSAALKPAREGWPNPDSTKIDAYTKAHNGHWDSLQTTATMAEYIDKIAVPQVKELLTNYGEVSVLWWDTPTNMTEEFADKIKDVLKDYPTLITNDRLMRNRPQFAGDFKTPEQKIPNLSELDGKDWEACMTMNGSWGWRSYKPDFKTSEVLIRNLVDIASKGGNYLLNVGPQADGLFPQQSIDGLKDIGNWMKVNGEAIYGTKASPLKPLSWGRCTSKEAKGGTVLYLSVFEWPKNGKLMVPDVKNKIGAVKLLANGKSLQTSVSAEVLTIDLPKEALDKIATVIKIELTGPFVGTVMNQPSKKMKTGALD